MKWAAAATTFLISATGCVPLLAPPAKTAVSTGVAVGDLDGSGETKSAQVTQWRAAVTPLALAEPWLDRPIDVGAGLVLEQSNGMRTASGWFANVTVHPWTNQYSERGITRLSLDAHAARLWTDGDAGYGYGVSAGFEVDGYVLVSGSDNGRGGSIGGGLVGEIGVGLEVGLDYRRLGRASYGVYRAGVTVRVPLTAAMLVCTGCLDLLRAAPHGSTPH